MERSVSADDFLSAKSPNILKILIYTTPSYFEVLS